MQQDGTQIIVDAMDDGANRKLCDAMARRKFTVTAKVSTVVSMGDKVGTAYNDTCRNSVFVPGSTIPYTQTSVPEVKAFRDAFARYQPGKPRPPVGARGVGCRASWWPRRSTRWARPPPARASRAT